MTRPKGMLVDIYRDGGPDCTNNGLSSRHDTVLLIGEGVPEIFEAKDGDAVVELVRWSPCGKEVVHVRPAGALNKDRHFMFGGNFIYSSDSRFPNQYPIPIHDRFETEEEMRMYSA